MLTITTKPGVTLCFVEAPHNVIGYDALGGKLYCYFIYWHKTFDLPPGNWEIVATTETLTEEQAKELVEEIRLHHPVDTRSQGCLDKDGYRNYAKGRLPVYYETALESLRSAIVASGGLEKTNYVILKQKL